VVVGLGGVTYLDLGGVAFIERLADAAQAAGHAFVLVEVPAAIQRILKILELDRTLTMVPTISDAATHLGLDPVLPERPVSEEPQSGLKDPQG
jgi:anti-anti-sigma regulatory factor